MKLLIVDDEELTREGLLASIDWESLKISQVYQACDGIQGIDLAKRYKPDIILSDVRMPKLDGIGMIEQLRRFLPNTKIIFMSGYSDKEYLKAAIRYKAVSYVEKPILSEEIIMAVEEAIRSIEEQRKTRNLELFHSHEELHHIAFYITQPQEVTSEIEHIFYRHFPYTGDCHFTTCIVKLSKPISEISSATLETIHTEFEQIVSYYKLQVMHVVKHDMYIVYHVFAESKPHNTLLDRITTLLQEQYLPVDKHFVVMGKTVCGLKNVYDSYCSAVIVLQRCFYHQYNSILRYNTTDELPNTVFTDPCSQFSEVLSTHDKNSVERQLQAILQQFDSCQTLLPNQVKDLYYKMFMMVEAHGKQIQMDGDAYGSILSKITDCQTLHELHHLLEDFTTFFFEALHTKKPENPTIFAIREFIKKNYANDTLSVKNISEHVYLSMSYICTLFKTETGQTLNQFITEYRIEKAKQLLEDPRYKITDISAKVGYSDGNYFGKSFKKMVGLSPSEYREKMLT